MTVRELIKKLKKMPQDIQVFVEAFNPDDGKWGNHHVDFVTHHYHGNKDDPEHPLISECVFMLNYDLSEHN